MWSVFCDCGFYLSVLWWVWNLPDRKDWLSEKVGLILMGGAMFSKSLTQFSVIEWGFISSLLFDLRQNYSGCNDDDGNLIQNVPSLPFCTQCPQCCSRPLLTHTSAGDSWTLTVKSGSISCVVTTPFSCVLVHTRFCLCLPRVCFPSPV